MYFRDNGGTPASWEWHAMADGGEITGGTAGTPREIATGTLTFDGNGALLTEAQAASTVDFVGATPGQAIAFDFGDAITTDGGTGRDGTQQNAAPFTTRSLDIDGHAAGNLVD